MLSLRFVFGQVVKTLRILKWREPFGINLIFDIKQQKKNTMKRYNIDGYNSKNEILKIDKRNVKKQVES